MKQAFANFLRKFDVEGYSPMSLLNIVLAAVTLVGGAIVVVFVGTYGFAGAFNSSEKMEFIISLLAAIISFALLIIRNLKIKSVPKIILYTILQFVIASIIVFYFLIRLISIGTSVFFGRASGTSSSSSGSIKLFPSGGKSSSGGYSDYEEAYAKANGYDNAQQANESGFNTSPANRSGFDYNQTESYHKEMGDL